LLIKISKWIWYVNLIVFLHLLTNLKMSTICTIFIFQRAVKEWIMANCVHFIIERVIFYHIEWVKKENELSQVLFYSPFMNINWAILEEEKCCLHQHWYKFWENFNEMLKLANSITHYTTSTFEFRRNFYNQWWMCFCVSVGPEARGSYGTSNESVLSELMTINGL
jgi:hypothetical protein